MDEVSLGRSLQTARQRAGLTQQGLCQKASISYSTLAKIERGAIKAPSIFTVQRIAEALGTSLDTLMGHHVQTLLPQEPITPLPPPKKQSKSGIKFVYFDVNGCLVRFFHRAFTRLADESGVSADVIETTFWHYNDAVCRGEMPMDEFNTVLARQLHMIIDWRSYYLEAIESIPEMRVLVTWAAEQYRVGLLTNIMPGFLEEMLNRDILPRLDYAAIVDSSAVKTIKPEPRMYEIALEMAGCAPNEVLLVDDSRSNLMGAERSGWHVLWFDDYRPTESVDRIKSALEFADTAPTAVQPMPQTVLTP